jgi:hypothetical protein
VFVTSFNGLFIVIQNNSFSFALLVVFFKSEPLVNIQNSRQNESIQKILVFFIISFDSK